MRGRGCAGGGGAWTCACGVEAVLLNSLGRSSTSNAFFSVATFPASCPGCRLAVGQTAGMASLLESSSFHGPLASSSRGAAGKAAAVPADRVETGSGPSQAVELDQGARCSARCSARLLCAVALRGALLDALARCSCSMLDALLS